MTDQRLEGRHVLITGGGGGIGSALAAGVTASGGRVFVADVDEAAAERTAASLPSAGWAAVDVRLPESVTRLVEAANAHGGPVDSLIAAHGLSTYVPFLELSLEEWDRIVSVNLTGTFVVGQVVARHLVEQGRGGSIVNLASTLGWVGAPNRVHYLASKGGVNLLTRGMALDLAPHGIRVNALGPGAIVTEMTRPRWDDPAALAAGPSDEASYTAGTTLYVDGGWTAQ